MILLSAQVAMKSWVFEAVPDALRAISARKVGADRYLLQ